MSFIDLPDDVIIHIANWMNEDDFIKYISSHKNYILYPFTLEINSYIWDAFLITKHRVFMQDYVTHARNINVGASIKELELTRIKIRHFDLSKLDKLELLYARKLYYLESYKLPSSITTLKIPFLIKEEIEKLTKLSDLNVSHKYIILTCLPTSIKKLKLTNIHNLTHLFNLKILIIKYNTDNTFQFPDIPDSTEEIYIRSNNIDVLYFKKMINVRKIVITQKKYINIYSPINTCTKYLKVYDIPNITDLDNFIALEQLDIAQNRKIPYHKTRNYKLGYY